jgi:hypothetical protein
MDTVREIDGSAPMADLEAELARARKAARARLVTRGIPGVEWCAVSSLLKAIDEVSRRLTALEYVGDVDLTPRAIVPVGFVDDAAE